MKKKKHKNLKFQFLFQNWTTVADPGVHDNSNTRRQFIFTTITLAKNTCYTLIRSNPLAMVQMNLKSIIFPKNNESF